MSSRQFTQWIAYFETEPFGDRVLHNMLAQLLYFSYAQVRTSDGPDLKPVDFAPGDKPTVDDEDKQSAMRNMQNVREFVRRGF